MAGCDGHRGNRKIARMTFETQPPAEPLSDRDEQFAREFVACLNATEAYARVNPDVTHKTAQQKGWRKTKNPKIAARIAELRKERQRATDIDTDYLLRKCVQTVNADPNELVELRRDCCRYCYGDGHRYQYTPAEWEAVLMRYQADCHTAELAGKRPPPEPDPRGGVGFHRRMPPLPTCPECHGEGVEDVHLKDTRLLSPEARQLYAGVRMTKHGLEIKTHDRNKNIEMAARMIGAFQDRVDHTNAGEKFEPMSLADFYGQPRDDSDDDEPAES